MTLDLHLLRKVKPIGDGYRAQCPACLEAGMDKSGDHLRIFPDGRWGCAVNPGDHEHRKRIWELAKGAGPVRRAPPPTLPPPTAIDVAALLKSWTDHTHACWIQNLAAKLGVSEESLVLLGCCWSPSHCAYGFPMFDGQGRPVGIRLRYLDGTKRAVAGTHNGLFAPKLAPTRPMLVCEGASDTAAALTLGFYAVGRPACNSGIAQLTHWIKRLGIQRAVIVADNDEDKFRPDGTCYNPGIDGAQRLAQEIGIPVCLIIPPAKDLRESVAFGMTKELVDSMIQSAVWYQPQQDERTQ